ncbi:MAG: urease subunit gamma [Nitrososphaerales archaeon]
MSLNELFFSSSSKEDDIMIEYAAHDALRKKYFGAKLNYKEVGILICWHVIEQARKGKTVKQIVDSSRKLLKTDDVMYGVPEIMQKLVVNVRFNNNKHRQIIIENPIKI